LLTLENHRDADTWGIRLLELADRGFAPRAVVSDGAIGLRNGQKLALSNTQCWGDHFHPIRDLNDLVRFLERRAYAAIDEIDRRLHKAKRHKERGGDLRTLGYKPNCAQAACDAAIDLYDDAAVLVDWLRCDVLAVAGPCLAERIALYDFVVAELTARAPMCPRRLQPICGTLHKHRDDFLAFARAQDEGLDALAREFEVAPHQLRRLLWVLSCDDGDPRRYTEEHALRGRLRDRYFEVCARVADLASRTVRASSLVENLNSRLRNYF
jgi:hypothetical protein